MKSIAILRHVSCEGPGYLGRFLASRGYPFQVIKIDQGAVIPEDPTSFSGLVFMGGPMSVNDPLPWIGPELDLIRLARSQDIPMLGHCLGAQLIARALGGEVIRNQVGEIGWHPVNRLDAGQAIMPELPDQFMAFHWHGERCTLPEGATPILESAYCPLQGFVTGRTLALQCHIEMEAVLVETWIERYREEIDHARSPSIQNSESMMRDLGKKIRSLHEIADIVYGWWIEELSRV